MLDKIKIINQTYSFFVLLNDTDKSIDALNLLGGIVLACHINKLVLQKLQVFLQRHRVELLAPDIVMTACIEEFSFFLAHVVHEVHCDEGVSD